MSKKINTNFTFTDKTTTGGESSSITYPPICIYYLPCGKCDKTNELCTYHHVVPIYPTQPIYPWWEGPYYKWWENPTCTSTSYTYTTNTTKTDENLMDNIEEES